MKKKIFVALDNSEISDALNITKEIKDYIAGIKLGLEFFTKNGPRGIEAFSTFDIPIFLDFKILYCSHILSIGAFSNLVNLKIHYTCIL